MTFANQIDPALKEQILTERRNALIIEGYGHELNRATAEAIGDEVQVQAADDAIAIIETAIAIVDGQLNG